MALFKHDNDSSSRRKCQFIVWVLSCNFQRRQLQDQQESSACYWLNQSHYFIRQLSVATYSRFVCCINVAHATDCTLKRRWLPVVSDKQQILYFCPVHCDTIVQLYNTNQRNARFSNEYFNSFFQLLMSSTCFEPHGFILRKTAVNTVFVWYVYMHWC
jgi:hypothetical protein